MNNLKAAVAEVFRREAAANAKPQGADIAEIIEQVAVEYGVEPDVLTEDVLAANSVGAW